jgi:hypothetical protein
VTIDDASIDDPSKSILSSGNYHSAELDQARGGLVPNLVVAPNQLSNALDAPTTPPEGPYYKVRFVGRGSPVYHGFYMMHNHPIETQGVVGRLERFRSDYLQFPLGDTTNADDVFQYRLEYSGSETALEYQAQD